jgi:hypothetical protein
MKKQMKKQYSNEIKVGSLVRLMGVVCKEHETTYQPYYNKVAKVLAVSDDGSLSCEPLDIINSEARFYIHPSCGEIDHIMS